MALGNILNIMLRRLVISNLKLERAIDNIILRITSDTLYYAGEDLEEALVNSYLNKDTLISIINQQNNISEALWILENSINTLERITGGASIVIDVSSKVAFIIKKLPLPTAPAPGIPVGIITTFADVLDKLNIKIIGGEATIEETRKVLFTIRSYVLNLRYKLITLGEILLSILNKFKQIESNNDFDELVSNINDSINRPIYSPIEERYENLEERLSPKSLNPIIYREYRLVLEYNTVVEPITNLPYRRVVAINTNDSNLVLIREFFDFIEDETRYVDDSWSYSDNLQILVDEIKFVIDYYIYHNNLPPVIKVVRSNKDRNSYNRNNAPRNPRGGNIPRN